jgi:hypothetical protein
MSCFLDPAVEDAGPASFGVMALEHLGDAWSLPVGWPWYGDWYGDEEGDDHHR